MSDEFAFRFDPRHRRWLALLGITPRTAVVTVTDTALIARFGRWTVSTPLDNIASCATAGPHRAYRAVGIRLSGTDRGITFGSNAHRTACITFREPVHGFDPLGVLRHPNLSVSVADPDALVARLRERA
jgi:hypothetical protein